MKVSTLIITDPEEFLKNEKDIAPFLAANSENPFTLSPFIKLKMFEVAQRNQTPAVVVTKLNGEIVGLTPLLLKRQLGIRYADCLFEPWASTDYVAKENYGPITVENVLHTIFRTLNCEFAVFHSPSESPHLKHLRQVSTSNKMPILEESPLHMSYGILPTNIPWENFYKSKGVRFRKTLRNTHNRLNKSVKWNLYKTENYGENEKEEDIYSKVLEIEKQSWKENLRKHAGETIDETVLWFLKSSYYARNEEGFRRKIWLLEIDNQPAAYSLEIQYKGTSYIAKSSFVDKYGKLSPGKLVMEAAIKDIFDNKEVQKIDFMTYLPLVRFWTPIRLPRVRLSIGNRTIMGAVIAKSEFNKILLHAKRIDHRDYYIDTARTQLKRIEKNR